MKYICAICGAEYTDEIVKRWGIEADTVGYGPKPCCIALLPEDPAIKKPDPATDPHYVCRGELVPRPTG